MTEVLVGIDRAGNTEEVNRIDKRMQWATVYETQGIWRIYMRRHYYNL